MIIDPPVQYVSFSLNVDASAVLQNRRFPANAGSQIHKASLREALWDSSPSPAFTSILCKAQTLKMKSREGRQVHSVSNAPFFSWLSRSRIMGCGQRTSEKLDTLHSSLKPINLALPPQWSSCLAATVFSLLHFHFISLTAQPLIWCSLPLNPPNSNFQPCSHNFS